MGALCKAIDEILHLIVIHVLYEYHSFMCEVADHVYDALGEGGLSCRERETHVATILFDERWNFEHRRNTEHQYTTDTSGTSGAASKDHKCVRGDVQE